jgi:hypothetical protein
MRLRVSVTDEPRSEPVLASWKDGLAKQAILHFVEAATTPGAAFVEPADRIAAFDNDGTLWVEQPIPPQFDFVFRKWGEEVKADPSLAEQQPYKALIDMDQAFFEGVATQDPEVVSTLLEAFARSWAGTTPEEFAAQVRDWTRTVKRPKLGIPYVEPVGPRHSLCPPCRGTPGTAPCAHREGAPVGTLRARGGPRTGIYG